MVKKNHILIVAAFLCYLIGNAQVIDDDMSINDSTQTEIDEVIYSDDELYISIEPAYSFREVTNNPKFVTGNAEDYANEESINSTSFTLGLRKALTKHLFLDIGVGFAQNGEFYNFEDADSLYEYKNTYRHLSFPIHFAYSYGDRVALYTGLGLSPKAFLSQKQDLRYSTPFTSFIEEEEIVTKEGFNLFVVDASFFLGVKLKLGENAGIHLMSIGGYQLNNTYDSMSNIIRKAYRIGGALGFYFNLQ